MKRLLPAILLALLILCFWFPSSGYASCFNPTGNAGDIVYNGPYRTFEYCNGGVWVSMGPVGNTTTGLVGWWKLDDGAGTSAADATGNGYTGTLTSGPTWTTGMNNGAVNFVAASSQYIKVPDTASLRLAGPWTIAAWVNPTSLPANGSAVNPIDRDSTCNGCNSNYKIAIDNNDHCGALAWRVAFDTSGGVSKGACYVTAIPTGVWYHVVGVWDGTTLTLYVNGVSVATNVPGAVPATGTGGDLGIGTEITQPRYFNGVIDDARVYNRALSAADVMTLYTSTGGTSGDIKTGLIQYWKLDESGATTAADASGNGNAGVATGTTVVAGRMLNGRSLTGADFLSAPNSASINNLTHFTASVWIKTTGLGSGAQTKFIDHQIYPTVGFALFDDGSFSTNVICRTDDGAFHDLTITRASVNDGSWHLLTCTYDGTTKAFYLDGVLQGSAAQGYNVDNTDAISSTPTPTSTISYDETRIYNRALSAADVLTLYNSTATACASPVGYAGDEIYNNGANHVPQYCNGTNWMAMGPVPGSGGGGCSSPAGSEGAMIYNSDYHTAQYCDGTSWRAMGGGAGISGLVGWWNLDEGSGTSAADSSGNNNTGTLTNGPTWTTSGKINDALTFNGTNQYVSVASVNLSATNAVTLSMWVNRTYTAATNDMLFEATPDTGSSTSGFYIYPDTSAGDCSVGGGHLDVSLRGDVNWSGACYNQPSSGAWHHLVAVYDKSQPASGEVTFYIDGVLQTPTNTNYNNNTNNFGNNPIYIASRGGASNYCAATIDDVRIYNRALSAAQVWSLYNGAP